MCEHYFYCPILILYIKKILNIFQILGTTNLMYIPAFLKFFNYTKPYKYLTNTTKLSWKATKIG